MAYDIHYQIVSIDQQRIAGRWFSFAFERALRVDGFQKLINRWLKHLFTPKGTDFFNRTLGTNFTNLIGANIASIRDATDAMTLFVDETNAQIRLQDRNNPSLADEEKLRSATLTDLVVNETGDGFDVFILIENVAGQELQFLLPVSGDTNG